MRDSLARDGWSARGRLTAATVALAASLTNFDVTAVAVVLPAIGAELGLPVGG